VQDNTEQSSPLTSKQGLLAMMLPATEFNFGNTHTHTHTHKIYNARYTMRPPQVCQPEPITTVILAQTAKCRHTWRTWYWWWDTRAVRCGRVARGTGASRRGPQSFTRNGDGPAIQYVQFMKLRPCCHDHWPMRPSSGHKAAACTSAASRLVRAVSQGGAIKAHCST
jgi:hypothetical protein